MNIPDTPEALFEALAEPSLRKLYDRFDDLMPRNQKLIRLLHTELTKGELSDSTFQQFVGFTIVLWRSFNRSALLSIQTQIDSEDEIDTEWVDTAVQLSRMDQYLVNLLAALETIPYSEDEASHRYLLRIPRSS